MHCFSLPCFQNFFVFSFQMFNYDVSCHRFLLLKNIWCLLSLLNLEASLNLFGIFSGTIPLNDVSFPHSLFPMGLWWDDYYFFYFPTGSWNCSLLFLFFVSLFSLLFRLYKLCWSLLTFVDYILHHLPSILDPIQQDIYLIYYILSVL